MHLVKTLRQAHGWSQRDLAQRAGCSGPHISAIENGKTLPSLRMLHRLAQALDVAEADLLLNSIADLCPTASADHC